MNVATVPVTPFARNCSLVLDEGTGRVALVDRGGDRARILEAVEKLGGQPEEILVTHAYLDHVGLVPDVAGC